MSTFVLTAFFMCISFLVVMLLYYAEFIDFVCNRIHILVKFIHRLSLIAALRMQHFMRNVACPEREHRWQNTSEEALQPPPLKIISFHFRKMDTLLS